MRSTGSRYNYSDAVLNHSSETPLRWTTHYRSRPVRLMSLFTDIRDFSRLSILQRARSPMALSMCACSTVVQGSVTILNLDAHSMHVLFFFPFLGLSSVRKPTANFGPTSPGKHNLNASKFKVQYAHFAEMNWNDPSQSSAKLDMSCARIFKSWYTLCVAPYLAPVDSHHLGWECDRSLLCIHARLNRLRN